MAYILFIEPDETLFASMEHFFSANGHEIAGCDDPIKAEELIESQVFDVIITAVPDRAGDLEYLLSIKREHNASALLIVSYDVETVDLAVQAVKEGAFDLIKRPYRIAELYVKIERAIEIRRLRFEAQSLRGERKLIYKTDDFIGVSPEFRDVLYLVEKIARTNSTVLITGETGTGKELIAGTIHYNSSRASGPYVKVNCASLSDALLESELFGHERGAFTGAENQRIGRFEHADGGSILLDEIGDISLRTQVKILRVLQEKELERVGSNRPISVDLRIIAATNRNLESMVADGSFREDLFYRLNVVRVDVPPLKSRRSDILPLAAFFLRKYTGDINKDVRDFDAGAVESLAAYNWPGNIRELENRIERAIIMTDGTIITSADLGFTATESPSLSGRLKLDLPDDGISLEEIEMQVILQALERRGWVQKDAAELLRLSRRALNYKIDKYGITHPSWRKHV
jgi:two-component system, NtrC family, response regulator AtoC